MSKALTKPPRASASAATDPIPSELLKYLEKYRVVVCTVCQYAIQPNAIARHLKEIHRITRSRRRPFMQHVSKFELAEQDCVVGLTPQDFPVPLLPVQSGLQCQYNSCLHLCATEKRMKSHWLSSHERRGQPIIDWKPVPLQTFFKGNLLRYFTGIPHIKEPDKKLAQFGCDNGVKNLEVNSEPKPAEAARAPLSPLSAIQLSNLIDSSNNPLLHHYIASTSLSLSTNSEMRLMWQVFVPQLAYQHQFLMHAILACSALHLAYQNPERQQELVAKATEHQDLGMPLFRWAMANPDLRNCEAVFLYTHLLVINCFALEKEAERLFMVDGNAKDDEGLPAWLFFIRGGCSMLCDVWDKIEAGPVRYLAVAWDFPIDISAYSDQPLIDYFVSVPHDDWDEQKQKQYRIASLELANAFCCMQAMGENATTWDIIRIWLMRIPVPFTDLLKIYDPGALILLAHYCIILSRVESSWYLKGRASRLLFMITRRLDEKWHRYIRWPLEEIGVSTPSGAAKQLSWPPVFE
ncbi:hypothetical protein HYALB_00010707 [Hymenoscyphus albidus]|uniref:C2H2-type domain-containing protein n=1 Tax=Hymenoscyphus albidus TaxID=595503 RepID=A0A9N9M2Q3_9HELO|nr:hypothetical protein HYALB_00010707 [Hymenoscyphus albidus]